MHPIKLLEAHCFSDVHHLSSHSFTQSDWVPSQYILLIFLSHFLLKVLRFLLLMLCFPHICSAEYSCDFFPERIKQFLTTEAALPYFLVSDIIYFNFVCFI